MLELKNEILSDEEIIKRLELNGICVIMKPVALMPDNLASHNMGKEPMGFVEVDIHDALNKLENKSKITKNYFFDESK